MTKSGNLDTLKKVFETQGQSTDKVKENTKKVVDTYTAEKAKSDYKATPISEIWPNETFGIKDEGFKNTFLSLDKKLLFITRKANNINYVPYAVAFKNANPTSVDANGTLKTDSETEKKFQEFILKDLATSIEKAHTDNAKIALPTDETSLVDAMTTVVQ